MTRPRRNLSRKWTIRYFSRKKNKYPTLSNSAVQLYLLLWVYSPCPSHWHYGSIINSIPVRIQSPWIIVYNLVKDVSFFYLIILAKCFFLTCAYTRTEIMIQGSIFVLRRSNVILEAMVYSKFKGGIGYIRKIRCAVITKSIFLIPSIPWYSDLIWNS